MLPDRGGDAPEIFSLEGKGQLSSAGREGLGREFISRIDRRGPKPSQSSSSSAGLPVNNRAGRTLAAIPKSINQTSPLFTAGIFPIRRKVDECATDPTAE